MRRFSMSEVAIGVDPGLTDEESILQSLEELQAQLNALQERAAIESTGLGGGRLFIASTRRPLHMEQQLDGSWTYRRSEGSIAAAVRALTGGSTSTTSTTTSTSTAAAAAGGAPGPSPAASEPSTGTAPSSSTSTSSSSWSEVWVTLGPTVPEAQAAAVKAKLAADYGVQTVMLGETTAKQFCEFSEILRIVCHSLPIPASASEQAAGWAAYGAANNAFADAIAAQVHDGDLVLVVDPELLLLPKLIRARLAGRNVAIALTLTTPFPAAELWRCLPAREPLLEGILGADVVVVQDFHFARHLSNAATQILGLEATPKWINSENRMVSVLIAPLGIETSQYAVTPEVQRLRQELPTALRFPLASLSTGGAGLKLIFSAETVDVTRGIPSKLLAFEELLSTHPEWKNKVVLLMLTQPADHFAQSAALKDLERTIDSLAGRINGRFSTPTWTPLQLLRTHVPEAQLHAMMSAADVALATSIRDGLTRVALEYAACQLPESPSGPGVVLLSELAGSSSALRGALLCNPYATKEVADALHAALTMGIDERRIRHAQIMAYARHNSASAWIQRVVTSARESAAAVDPARQPMPLDPLHLVHAYKAAVGPSGEGHRLIVCSLNGTLQPYQGIPDLAAPSARVRRVLLQLVKDPRNVVWLVTWDRADVLDLWLADVPVGLAAEHGFRFRPPPPPAVAAQVAATLLSRMDEAQAAAAARTAPGAAAPSNASTGSVEAGGVHPLAASGHRKSMSQLNLPRQAPEAIAGWVPAPPSLWRHFGEPITPAPVAVTDTKTVQGPGVAQQPTASAHGGAARRHGDAVATFGSSRGGAGAGATAAADVDVSWHEEVASIMRYFAERTPGSVLSVGEATAAFAWSECDPHFGNFQARTLQLHLQQMLFAAKAEVVLASSKKYIYVRPLGVTKGAFVARLLTSSAYGSGARSAKQPQQQLQQQSTEQSAQAASQEHTPYFTFLLTMGDERTDTDMVNTAEFAPALPPGAAFGVLVGKAAQASTAARYSVATAGDALAALSALVQ